jgi:uncharacterized protein (DUF952 family)
MVRVVYKICPTPPWSEAERAAAFRGSEADRRNGFIHFSMAAQVVETARKHFAGQGDLLLVSVDADRLGNRLRWEPSRAEARYFRTFMATLILLRSRASNRCRWG